VINPAFAAFITHYRCKPVICQRARPETKGNGKLGIMESWRVFSAPSQRYPSISLSIIFAIISQDF
jgi:hypothetical protein